LRGVFFMPDFQPLCFVAYRECLKGEFARPSGFNQIKLFW